MRLGLESLGGPGSTRSDSKRGGLPRACREGVVWMGVLFILLASAAPGRSAGLKADEQVIFYPSLARPVPGGWEIEAHGLVYEPERRRMATGLLRRLLGFEEEDLSAADVARFRERIGFFFVDDERDKEIAVRVGAQSVQLARSRANGHFFGRWSWPTNQAVFASWIRAASNGVVRLELPLEGAQGRSGLVEIHLVTEGGVSVISDIDDTIKISEVRDREALLKNTFCRPFQSVPGMAGRYREWERAGAGSGVRFHYVTASPWQLYVPLSEFTRSNGFPAGTFHMKDFRLKDSSALNLLTSPERYKLDVLEPLFRQFPQRSFVLVGDSGEADPEIYGEAARRYPRQVRRVFIRNVTSEDGEAARYRTAFREVPRAVWWVFADPAELPGALDEVGKE